MGRSSLVAALAAGAGLLGAAPAHAAPTWLAPTEIGTPDIPLSSPAAAVDGVGDVTVAYAGSSGLLVAQHPEGGAWDTPVPVASADGQPVLAENSSGDTVLAEENGGQIEATVHPAGQPWAPSTTLTDLGAGGGPPSVAIDGQGDVLVVWLVSGQLDTFTTLESAYRPAGGSWETTVVDNQTQVWTGSPPVVAFTAGGLATVVWAAYNGPNQQVLDSATLTAAGGGWSSPSPVGSANFLEGAHLAVNDAGVISVAYLGYDSGSKETDMIVAEPATDGTWSIDDLGQDNTDQGFDIAIDTAGDVALIYGSETSLEADEQPAGGVWGLPKTIGTGDSDFAQIVLGPTGTATADWVGRDGNGQHPLITATLPAGGTWTTPVTLVPNTLVADGQTVADAAGDVDTVHVLFDGTDDEITSVAEEVAGPTLDDLSVPASGTVGVPVLFSVDPVDAWSAIGQTTWNFGDGQSLPDEVVAHTYTAPGTYTVRTTSSDTLGNTTTQGSTIVIQPASTLGTPLPGLRRTPLALTLTHVTQSHRRWREAIHGRARTAALRRTRVGTRFGFTINQAARVTFTFRGTHPRRRVRGQITRHFTAAGHHIVRFAGRVGSRRLKPGRYTVTIHATGSGGAATHRLRFTLA
jgi:PKD domain